MRLKKPTNFVIAACRVTRYWIKVPKTKVDVSARANSMSMTKRTGLEPSVIGIGQTVAPPSARVGAAHPVVHGLISIRIQLVIE